MTLVLFHFHFWEITAFYLPRCSCVEKIALGKYHRTKKAKQFCQSNEKAIYPFLLRKDEAVSNLLKLNRRLQVHLHEINILGIIFMLMAIFARLAPHSRLLRMFGALIRMLTPCRYCGAAVAEKRSNTRCTNPICSEAPKSTKLLIRCYSLFPRRFPARSMTLSSSIPRRALF